jgi:hypothetical protein
LDTHGDPLRRARSVDTHSLRRPRCSR